MKILSRFFLLLALIFIGIGDGVFFCVAFIQKVFLFLWDCILFLAHHVASFLLQSLPRPRRRVVARIPYTIPIRLKIRYFSIGVVFCFLFVGIPLLLMTLFSLLPSPKNLAI